MGACQGSCEANNDEKTSEITADFGRSPISKHFKGDFLMIGEAMNPLHRSSMLAESLDWKLSPILTLITRNKEMLSRFVHLQSRMRRCIAKLAVKRRRQELTGANRLGRYFTASEFKETIQADRKFSASSPLETRTHTYKCSAAKYEGSWLQGFRHGKGTMTWEDGAKFTGLWAHGMPTGKGMFVFT